MKPVAFAGRGDRTLHRERCAGGLVRHLFRFGWSRHWRPAYRRRLLCRPARRAHCSGGAALLGRAFLDDMPRHPSAIPDPSHPAGQLPVGAGPAGTSPSCAGALEVRAALRVIGPGSDRARFIALDSVLVLSTSTPVVCSRGLHASRHRRPQQGVGAGEPGIAVATRAAAARNEINEGIISGRYQHRLARIRVSRGKPRQRPGMSGPLSYVDIGITMLAWDLFGACCVWVGGGLVRCLFE